jgi:hypothetical protein
MKRYLVILINLFVPIILLPGCLYEELTPPDICGIYTGTREYKHFKNELLIIDIQTVDEDGISGIVSYENDTSFYSCRFTGEWSENDNSVDIYFRETEVLTRINFYSAPLCRYNAEIRGGNINGTFSYSNRTYNFSAEKQISEVVLTPDTGTNNITITLE